MVIIGDITRLSYLVCPAVISTINHSEDRKKSRDKATTKLSRGGPTLYITYTLWLFNSSPWKITMLLRTVNHLFRLGPSIPWQTVSHNRRVSQYSHY